MPHYVKKIANKLGRTDGTVFRRFYFEGNVFPVCPGSSLRSGSGLERLGNLSFHGGEGEKCFISLSLSTFLSGNVLSIPSFTLTLIHDTISCLFVAVKHVFSFILRHVWFLFNSTSV